MEALAAALGAAGGLACVGCTPYRSDEKSCATYLCVLEDDTHTPSFFGV